MRHQDWLTLRQRLYEIRFNPQLMHGLDHTAQVVTKRLAQSLVDLRRECPAPQALTELRLDRVKGLFRCSTACEVL